MTVPPGTTSSDPVVTADRDLPDGPSPAAVTAWARLVRAATRLRGAVEAELKSAGLPPLAWYDVLLELDRAGDEGLRPFELQRRLLLEQYNLSRLADRMAAAGLLRRDACDDDRRGQRLALTGAGRALRRAMWPVYAAAIKAHIGDRLTARDAARLADLLAPLAAPDAGGQQR